MLFSLTKSRWWPVLDSFGISIDDLLSAFFQFMAGLSFLTGVFVVSIFSSSGVEYLRIVFLSIFFSCFIWLRFRSYLALIGFISSTHFDINDRHRLSHISVLPCCRVTLGLMVTTASVVFYLLGIP